MTRIMKDSGIDWIGMIPEKWNICRVKNFYIYHKIVTKEKNDEYERLALTLNGVIKRSKEDSNGLQPEDFSSYQLVNKNDYIFKLIDLENVNTSRIGKSNYEGIVSPAYIVMSPKIDSNFGLYYFQNMWYQEIFNNIGGNGVRSAINKNDLLNTPYISIPIEEQNKIVNFLDNKCDTLNNIIEKNKKSIELMEEYKKSFITEKITKGINKRDFKETNIEWIGTIPDDWSIVRLKKIGIAQIGLTYSPDDISTSGNLVLRSSNVQNGKILLLDNVYVRKEIPKKMIVQENDLLICARNGSKDLIGKCALIPKEVEGSTYGAFMTLIRCNYNKYLYYILNSELFKYNLGTFLTSTINQLTSSNLNNMKIPLPGNDKEINQIVKYLDNRCSKIDKVIEYRKKIIDKLEEYKKSLIYEAITGKIEV